MSVRLNKLLALCGAAPSRRHAEAIIFAGRVTILSGGSSSVLSLGASVPSGDVPFLRLDGLPLPEVPLSSAKLFAIHKPRGFLSAWRDVRSPPRGTLTDLLSLRGAPPSSSPRLIHAGRLDYDSEGLLLLTTDGDLALRITHPSVGCSKDYLAVATPRKDCRQRCPVLELPSSLTRGVIIDTDSEATVGGVSRPAAARDAEVVRWNDAVEVFKTCGIMDVDYSKGAVAVKVTLNEGRKRVVRRMFDALGWRVERLLRMSVGNVSLGTMQSGSWVELRASDFKNEMK
jgi:pseudouridine synthase